MNEQAKVNGFINETHANEIEATFGKELADRVKNAEAGTTFLSLLFADFAKK